MFLEFCLQAEYFDYQFDYFINQVDKFQKNGFFRITYT